MRRRLAGADGVAELRRPRGSAGQGQCDRGGQPGGGSREGLGQGGASGRLIDLGEGFDDRFAHDLRLGSVGQAWRQDGDGACRIEAGQCSQRRNAGGVGPLAVESDRGDVCRERAVVEGQGDVEAALQVAGAFGGANRLRGPTDCPFDGVGGKRLSALLKPADEGEDDRVCGPLPPGSQSLDEHDEQRQALGVGVMGDVADILRRAIAPG